jgi:hypothetical protein
MKDLTTSRTATGKEPILKIKGKCTQALGVLQVIQSFLDK